MDQVIVYSSAHFQGTATPLAIGRNSAVPAGMSIQIPTGWLVSLYDSAGRVRLLTQSTDGLFGTYTAAVVTQPDRPIPDRALDKLRKLIENGLTFDFFTARNTSSLKLDGQLQVSLDPSGASVTVSGQMDLGAPLSTALAAVTITLSLGDAAFKVAVQLPGLMPVFQRGVLDRVSAGVRAKMDQLVTPYVSALAATRFEISASAQGQVSVDAYASVQLAALPPLNLVDQQLPRLGLRQILPPIDLHLGCSAGATLSFVVEASAAFNLRLGTDALHLTSVSLSVNADTTDLSAGLGLGFAIQVGRDKLLFDATLEGEASGAVKIVGTLRAPGGSWDRPLGIPGLSLRQVTMGLGATAEAPWVAVQLYAGGQVRLGDAVIDADVGLNVDPAEWANTVLLLDCHSDLRLGQLLGALLGGAFPVEKVVDVQVKRPRLVLAPSGGSFGEVTVPAGYQIKGDLSLWGWHAAVDGLLDPRSGGHLYAAMDPVRLRLSGVDVLSISNAAASGGPRLAMDISASSFAATIDGAVRVFDAANTVHAAVSPSGFALRFTSAAFEGIYNNAQIAFSKSGFALDLSTQIHLHMPITDKLVITMDLDARAHLSAGTSGALSQTVSFQGHALGGDIHFAAVPWIAPLRGLGDVAAVFRASGERAAIDWTKAKLRGIDAALASWIHTNLSTAATDLARLLSWAGMSTGDIVNALVKYANLSLSEALSLLNSLS